MPTLLAAVFWGVIFFSIADDTQFYFTHTVSDGVASGWDIDWLLAYAGYAILFIFWMPLVYVSALLLTSSFLMPMLLKHVSKHYPSLERNQQSTFLPSLSNAIKSLLIYMFLWLLLLPLVLLVPLGFMASFVLNGWLNKRIFAYDVLADFATPQELSYLKEKGLWLGVALSLVLYIPVFNLFAVLFTALVFCHFYLNKLEHLRQLER